MGGVQALVITGVPTLTPLISMPSLYRRQFNSPRSAAGGCCSRT